MKRTIITTLLAMAVIAFALPTTAAEKGKEKKKSDTFPFNGKVTAVDKTAKTFSLAGKDKPRVFEITSQTKITKAGKPAILDDAVVGEDAGGVAKRGADGKNEAVSVRFGPKPEGSGDKKKEAKPKK
mgnify:FL=1